MNERDLYFDKELETLLAYEELDEALAELFYIFYRNLFEPIGRFVYERFTFKLKS